MRDVGHYLAEKILGLLPKLGLSRGLESHFKRGIGYEYFLALVSRGTAVIAYPHCNINTLNWLVQGYKHRCDVGIDFASKLTEPWFYVMYFDSFLRRVLALYSRVNSGGFCGQFRKKIFRAVHY